jgi:hypothetical protein
MNRAFKHKPRSLASLSSLFGLIVSRLSVRTPATLLESAFGVVKTRQTHDNEFGAFQLGVPERSTAVPPLRVLLAHRIRIVGTGSTRICAQVWELKTQPPQAKFLGVSPERVGFRHYIPEGLKASTISSTT